MFRTLAIAALLTAVALPAVALPAVALPAAAGTTVTVNVAGQDAKAAHAAIVQAAKTACRAEFLDAWTFEQYYLWSDCLNSAVTRAEVNLEATKVATAGSTVVAAR